MSNVEWFLDQARKGNLFRAANQAAATVTLIDTSTATGFILSNPWGSGKKLIVKSYQFAYTTVPTATAIVFIAQSIAVSATAHATVTALGVYRADGSGVVTGAPAGRAYNASTTPNLPVYAKLLGYSPTTPATTGVGVLEADLSGGEVILVPGTYIQTSYITTAPVGITSCVWAEVDE